MKHLIVLAILISGCASGKGDGSKGGTTTPTITPVCKDLFSVWQSTTDQESHDFTQLTGEVVLQEYQYTAYDGAICGYVNNPNQNLSAQLVATPNVAWDYRLEMNYSLAMGGQCATYEVNGSIGHRQQTAYIIETACNQIKICVDANVPSTCKIFE